jgi:hypothetical protein
MQSSGGNIASKTYFLSCIMSLCIGISHAASISWDGTSSDITGLSANINSTPNSWGATDTVWSTTDEVVAAVGSQASFTAAIGILPGQRRIAQINAGSDQIFVGGNELAPTGLTPYTTLVGFDTSAFGAAEVLTGISVNLRTRPTGDTMSVRWFAEAGGSTYVSDVIGSVTGAAYQTLTTPDATAIEWFAFDKNANIGSAVGPYDGKLDNGGEEIELQIPGDQEYGKNRYWIPIEKIDYDDIAPWPTSAHGGGDSLDRDNINAYSRDYSNWSAATPTPGY